MHTTLGTHKQILLPTFMAPLSPQWHVFEKGALSFGGAAGQKQSYFSIPVPEFFVLLFQKEEPSSSFLKTCQCTEAEKVKSGNIASVCKVFSRVHQQ
jgi:hypothetical protein